MKKELTVAILNSTIGEGEAGDPLTQPVQDLIRAMAAIGWWVVDFGESSDPEVWNNDMTDLHFAWGGVMDETTQTAEYFIKTGGNV